MSNYYEGVLKWSDELQNRTQQRMGKHMLIGCVVGGLAGSLIAYYIKDLYQEKNPKENSDSRSRVNSLEAPNLQRAMTHDLDRANDSKIQQLSASNKYHGDLGQQKIENSFVIVVGQGGVGSHVTASLARAGVSRIRIIDFDNVSLSS